MVSSSHFLFERVSFKELGIIKLDYLETFTSFTWPFAPTCNNGTELLRLEIRYREIKNIVQHINSPQVTLIGVDSEIIAFKIESFD